MNITNISKLLSSGKTLFILDSFAQIALRIVPNGKSMHCFIRHIGRPEIEIAYSEPVVIDTIMGGKEITHDEYYKF